jgi:hypothetical protein
LVAASQKSIIIIIIIIIINVDFELREFPSTGRASAANAISKCSILVYSTGGLV